MTKVGRNDPCPCGSGKKYKACHMKESMPGVKKKFKASVLSEKKSIDLMERTFGEAIARGQKDNRPPIPPQEATEMEQGPVKL
jgi:hypothetical protein